MSDYCYTAGESPFCPDMSDVSICKNTNRSTYSSIINVAAAASARERPRPWSAPAPDRPPLCSFVSISSAFARFRFRHPRAPPPRRPPARLRGRPSRARAARPATDREARLGPPSIATAARGTLRALGFPGTPVAFPGPPGTFSWSRRRNPTGTKCGARSASSRWIARCRRLSETNAVRTALVDSVDSVADRSTRARFAFRRRSRLVQPPVLEVANTRIVNTPRIDRPSSASADAGTTGRSGSRRRSSRG